MKRSTCRLAFVESWVGLGEGELCVVVVLVVMQWRPRLPLAGRCIDTICICVPFSFARRWSSCRAGFSPRIVFFACVRVCEILCFLQRERHLEQLERLLLKHLAACPAPYASPACDEVAFRQLLFILNREGCVAWLPHLGPSPHPPPPHIRPLPSCTSSYPRFLFICPPSMECVVVLGVLWPYSRCGALQGRPL